MLIMSRLTDTTLKSGAETWHQSQDNLLVFDLKDIFALDCDHWLMSNVSLGTVELQTKCLRAKKP